MTDSEKLDVLINSNKLLLEGQGKVMQQILTTQQSMTKVQGNILQAMRVLSQSVSEIKVKGEDTNLKTGLVQKMFDNQLNELEQHIVSVDKSLNNVAGYMNKVSQNMEMLTNQIGDLQYGKEEKQTARNGQNFSRAAMLRDSGLPDHLLD